MPSHLRRFSTLVVLLAIATPAYADVAPCFLGWFTRRDRERPPRFPAPPPEYDLVIVTDPNAKQAELRIPRRMTLADAGGPQPRTAMAGLALSAAIVGGGLWCMRCRADRIPKKTVCVAGALALLVLGGLVVNSYVDARMQPARMVPLGPPPSVLLFENVEVTVNIVEQGDEVQLVVPPDLAAKIEGRTR